MRVLLDRFGERVWIEVSSLAGEVIHPDASGNFQPVGKVLFESEPVILEAIA